MMTIDPMTKCRRILLGYLIGTLIFGFAACTDEVGDKALSGSGSITFTVGGIAEGGAETLTRAQLEPQTLRQDLGDGLSLVYTLSIDPASLTRTSSNMAAGTKYRVIAYKKNGSKYDYAKEKVFEAETSGSLDGLETAVYKIAAYSYNTSTDPGKIENSPDGDSDDTKLTVEDTSQDLLHWASSSDIDLSSGSASPVSITFKHRFPTVTLKVSSSLTGDFISDVNATATLSGYKAVQTLYNDAVPAEGSSISTQIFSPTTEVKTDTSFVSNTRRVFTGSSYSVTFTFNGTIDVNTDSGTRTINGPFSVSFTSPTYSTLLAGGYSYTLKMHIEASKGDYYPIVGGSAYEATIPLGSAYSSYNGGSLTFLTYNLGADPSLSPKQQMAYPYTDLKNIRVYGGLYQWGRNDRQHSLRDPLDDSDTEHFYEGQLSSYDGTQTQFAWGTNGTWLSGDGQTSYFWGNATVYNADQAYPPPSAGTYNPCPSGYRVPTQYEWALIFNDNGTSGTPAPNSITGDNFLIASTGDNCYKADANQVWAIPYSNHNVVWVIVRDGKATTEYQTTTGHANGLAVYKVADLPSGWDNATTGTFVPGKDLTLDSAPTPLMFLPTSGSYRDYKTGNISATSIVATYWSCTIGSGTTPISYRMRIGREVILNTVSASYHYRAYGCAVRCVKI